MEGRPYVRVVAVPYDSGHPRLRMGAGPEHLLNNGLGEALRSRERSLSFATVCPETDPPAEVATAFELDGLVSGQVRAAVAEGEFPLVLSGDCNTSVGTLAGLNPDGLGVVWFDGHADFNTLETTTTGFSDNMGLAIAVGQCWKKMAGGVPGFSPVAEEDVVLAGAREIEPAEEERLAASGVAVVGADRIVRDGSRAFAMALDGLKARVARVYVHLDLDVLDPAEVANGDRRRLNTTLISLGEKCKEMDDDNCRSCVEDRRRLCLRSLVARRFSDHLLPAHKSIELSDIRFSAVVNGEELRGFGY